MRILVAALFCTWTYIAHAQDTSTLLPVKVKEKWGYINQEGQIVVQPVFDGVTQFSRNLTVMQINNRRGVIDRNSKILIPAAYKDAKILTPGLVAVKNNKWGIRDTTNLEILEQNYDDLKALTDSIILFKEKDVWGALNISTKAVLAAEYDAVTDAGGAFLLLTKRGKYGIAGKNMKVLYAPFADEILANKDVNAIIFRENKAWGVGDTSGNKASEAVYQNYQILNSSFISFTDTTSLSLYSVTLNRFINEGLFQEFMALENDFIIGIVRKKSQVNLYALLDPAGNIILPAEYDYISDGNEGFYLIRKNGLWGFLNSKGEIKLQPRFHNIDRFQGKIARVAESGKQGIINSSGKLLASATYNAIQIIDGTAKCYANGSMDLITFDEKGEIYEKIHYKNVRTIDIENTSRWEFNPSLVMPQANIRRNAWSITGSRVQDLFLISEPVRYSPNLRMRCDIPKNFVLVTRVYGMRDSSRVIFKPQFWNFEINDFEEGTYARIIYEGGRHAFISRAGHAILDYPIKKNGRPARERIAFIGNFSEGLARVNLGGKLSTKGPEEVRMLTSYNSLADVGPVYCNGGKWGFVNREGKLVVNAEFDFVMDFKNGVAIVKKDGLFGLINQSGNFIIPAKYHKIEFLPNSRDSLLKLTIRSPKEGIISRAGHVILPAVYDDVSLFSEGKAVVKKDNMYGYVDESGKLVIPDTFSYALPFKEGLAPVMFNNRWGYIDHSGTLVIKNQYNKARQFHNGVAVIEYKHRAAIIDKNGNYIIGPKLTNAQDFKDEHSVARYKGRYGMLNTKGKWVIPPHYNYVSEFNQYGLCQVRKGKKYHLLNSSGKKVGHHYEKIGRYSEGHAAVKTKKYWGFIDSAGVEVIKPEYYGVGDFHEGLAKYSIGGKWGYIDKQNKKIIPPTLRFAGDFKDGFASFIDRGKVSLIDKSGEIVHQLNTNWFAPFQEGYALIKTDTGKIFINHFGENTLEMAFMDATLFHDGIALVKRTGKWGILNDAGIFLAPCRYEYISEIEDGGAIFSVSTFEGIANCQGKLVLNTEFEQVNIIQEGLFCVERSGALYYMDYKGKWIWKP